jgi:chromosome segregation ATPase
LSTGILSYVTAQIESMKSDSTSLEAVEKKLQRTIEKLQEQLQEQREDMTARDNTIAALQQELQQAANAAPPSVVDLTAKNEQLTMLLMTVKDKLEQVISERDALQEKVSEHRSRRRRSSVASRRRSHRASREKDEIAGALAQAQMTQSAQPDTVVDTDPMKHTDATKAKVPGHERQRRPSHSHGHSRSRSRSRRKSHRRKSHRRSSVSADVEPDTSVAADADTQVAESTHGQSKPRVRSVRVSLDAEPSTSTPDHEDLDDDVLDDLDDL